MRKETIWSVPFVVLMASNFFQSTAAFMTNTTLPVYLAQMGITASVIGIVVGAFAASALAVRPFAGPAFDSLPRKKFLIFSQALIAASMFSYGFIHDPWGIFFIRLLHGVGIGCSGPLAMSLVTEYLPASRFASGVSIYALAQSFAQVIGPALGLWLIDVVGFAGCYCICGGSLVLAIIGIAMVHEPERQLLKYEIRFDRIFAKEALDKGLVMVLFFLSFSCVNAYLVLYAMEMHVENIGLFFVVYALVLVVSRPLYGRLSDKHGAQRVLLFGVVCFALSFIILSFARDLPMILVAAVVSGFGFGACAPLVQSLALGSVGPERRGSAGNTTYTGMDIGSLFGPFLGGFMAECMLLSAGSMAVAYSWMWLVLLVPIAAAFCVIIKWNMK